MPELPQMQALAERLEAAIGGHRLIAADALGFTALKTVTPAPDAVVGHVVEHVGRRGKYLVLDFDDGHRVMVHLSQAGRVDIEERPKTTRPKGAVVRLRFATPDGELAPSGASSGVDRRGHSTPAPSVGAASGASSGVDRRGHSTPGSAVLVREHGTERKAAWWVLAPGDPGPLEGLGPEPDSDEFAELVLHGTDSRRIHTWLRDQRTVAGVGRGYADDTLWRARISPYAKLAQLDADRRAGLLDAVRSVLNDGLVKERERTGGLAEPRLGTNFEVHGHAGDPCPRCAETLRRVSYESYEVVYCPACQTDGKVLADRRLSRLVK
jgi:formamidopyrimidine-DNA glycosylase